jgi:hypothetical protein
MSTKEEKELIDPVDLIESYIHCKEAIRNDLLAKILVKISCKEKIFAKAANNKIWKSVLQCKSLQDRSRLCLWVSLCNISINSDVLLDVVNYENDNKMKYRWLRVIYSKTIDNPSYINKKSIKTLESMIVMPIDSNSYTMIMNILHIHRNSNEV